MTAFLYFKMLESTVVIRIIENYIYNLYGNRLCKLGIQGGFYNLSATEKLNKAKIRSLKRN